LSRSLTPSNYCENREDLAPLLVQQSHPMNRGSAPIFDNSPIDPAGWLPCVIYRCAPDLLLISISPNAFERIGIRPENVIDNRSFWEERLIPEDRTRLLSKLNRLNLTEIDSEIHRILDDQGLPVWVVHHFRKIQRRGDTAIVGYLSPLANDFLDKIFEPSTISQFVHKIGNHFQLLNLLVGSLRRTASRMDEIEALQQTIDRAVEFTRSFSHYCQPPACASAVDLAEMLRSIIAAAAEGADQEVSIQNLVEESFAGARINGDAFLLELAFSAILKNAVEATRCGGEVRVTATVTDSLAARSIARIAIADTGCGIEGSALGHAADPFVSSKRDRDGLGLSMAVRVIEMHGGTLKISSTLGQGTQILIALPVNCEPIQAL
jgi:histidine kinase/DNA gyrase B/HSP90-like ATPase